MSTQSFLNISALVAASACVLLLGAMFALGGIESTLEAGLLLTLWVWIGLCVVYLWDSTRRARREDRSRSHAAAKWIQTMG